MSHQVVQKDGAPQTGEGAQEQTNGKAANGAPPLTNWLELGLTLDGPGLFKPIRVQSDRKTDGEDLAAKPIVFG